MGLEYLTAKQISDKKLNIKNELLKKSNYFIRNGIVFKLLQKYLNNDGALLEVGCGAGELTEILLDNDFKNVHLIDIENYLSDNATNRVDVHLSDVSYNELPFEKNFFDIVLAIAIIEHLENPFFLYREVHRVLKPGGKFIVAIPNALSLKSRINFLLSGNVTGFNKHNNHISFFSKDVFHKVISNKFKVVDKFFSKGFIKIFGKKFRLENNLFNKNFGTKELIILEKL